MTEAEARALLRHAGVPDPAGDALRLRDHAPTDDAFAAMIHRRAAREPVSHITGRRAFWNHTFVVTPDVLDPRPETETLVEAALAEPFDTLLDLGTGSACILASLLGERSEATGTGTDISDAALKIAAQNLDIVGVAARATLLTSDWFAQVSGTFDLIVSNPPYIATAQMTALSPEVRREPALALTPGDDGLAAYRTIVCGASRFLNAGGRLIVEVGQGQAGDVVRLFDAAAFTETREILDLDGRKRVVSGRMRGN